MTTVEEGEVIEAGSIGQGLIRPPVGKRTLMARLIDSLGDEARAQQERWPLWSSVCFGAGCAAYFALKAEPAAWPSAAVALALLGAWIVGRARGLPRWATLILLMLACLSGGLAVAKLRADAVAAPIAPAARSVTA